MPRGKPKPPPLHSQPLQNSLPGLEQPLRSARSFTSSTTPVNVDKPLPPKPYRRSRSSSVYSQGEGRNKRASSIYEQLETSWMAMWKPSKPTVYQSIEDAYLGNRTSSAPSLGLPEEAKPLETLKPRTYKPLLPTPTPSPPVITDTEDALLEDHYFLEPALSYGELSPYSDETPQDSLDHILDATNESEHHDGLRIQTPLLPPPPMIFPSTTDLIIPPTTGSVEKKASQEKALQSLGLDKSGAKLDSPFPSSNLHKRTKARPVVGPRSHDYSHYIKSRRRLSAQPRSRNRAKASVASVDLEVDPREEYHAFLNCEYREGASPASNKSLSDQIVKEHMRMIPPPLFLGKTQKPVAEKVDKRPGVSFHLPLRTKESKENIASNPTSGSGLIPLLSAESLTLTKTKSSEKKRVAFAPETKQDDGERSSSIPLTPKYPRVLPAPPPIPPARPLPPPPPLGSPLPSLPRFSDSPSPRTIRPAAPWSEFPSSPGSPRTTSSPVTELFKAPTSESSSPTSTHFLLKPKHPTIQALKKTASNLSLRSTKKLSTKDISGPLELQTQAQPQPKVQSSFSPDTPSTAKSSTTWPKFRSASAATPNTAVTAPSPSDWFGSGHSSTRKPSDAPSAASSSAFPDQVIAPIRSFIRKLSKDDGKDDDDNDEHTAAAPLSAPLTTPTPGAAMFTGSRRAFPESKAKGKERERRPSLFERAVDLKEERRRRKRARALKGMIRVVPNEVEKGERITQEEEEGSGGDGGKE